MGSEPPRDELTPIEAEVLAGRKIHAIKMYRDLTGAGLAEAKQAVDEMEDRLRAESPERFSVARPKAGCAGMILVAVGAFAPIVSIID